MKPGVVIEAEEYGSAKRLIIEELGINQAIFDDLQQTFDLTIARNPEVYPPILEGTQVRMFKTRSGILPSMHFWYAVTGEDQVTLLYVEKAPEIKE